MDIFSLIFGRKGGGGGSVTVDPAISGASENPVQNKAIKTALDLKADKTQLPTKLTDLTNDAGFVTGDDVTDEIADAIGEITSFEYYLCGSGEYDAQGVPTVQSPDTSHIYLTPTSGDNLYMYAYINGDFVFLGTTEMDLDGYVTETAMEAALATKADAADVQEEYEVTGTFTDFSTFVNPSKNAQEIYTAYQAGKRIAGRFTFTVPFIGNYQFEMRLLSCFQWENDSVTPPKIGYAAMFAGVSPIPDFATDEKYKYIILTLEYSGGTQSVEVTVYTLPLPGEAVPDAAEKPDGRVPVTQDGVWEAKTLADVAFSGSYNDLSNKPTIPVAPNNLVTGSASAYTINVSGSAPAAGTASNVITIVV